MISKKLCAFAILGVLSFTGAANSSVSHPAGLNAIPLSGWGSFSVTPGWTDFVFATSNADVNPQSAAHIETLLETSAWFNQPLDFRGKGRFLCNRDARM